MGLLKYAQVIRKLILGGLAISGTSETCSQESSKDLPGLVSDLRKKLEGSSQSGIVTLEGQKVAYFVEFKNGSVILQLPEQGRVFAVSLGGVLKTSVTEQGHTRILSREEAEKAVKQLNLSVDEVTFRFLFFDTISGAENAVIRGRNCTGIHFADTRLGASGNSFTLWIDEQFESPLRFMSYGSDGRPIRRFDVISVKRDQNERWRIQKVRVSDIASRKISYIDF